MIQLLVLLAAVTGITPTALDAAVAQALAPMAPGSVLAQLPEPV